MSTGTLSVAWWLVVLLGVASGGAASADEERTVLEVRSAVPLDHDGCLDHAVRELGMSAKRRGKERVWDIGPQFLHPSITPAGTIVVEVRKQEKQSDVLVTATWTGKRKEPGVERELEQRAAAMVTMMSRLCGASTPALACTVKEAGSGTPAPCAHAPQP